MVDGKAPNISAKMDPHTAQVIFQVLMSRTPEFLLAVSQEAAHMLHQDRLAKITYQQALQQASVAFVNSLCRTDLTAETAFNPIVFPLPEDETDLIAAQNFNFSKRHFATNVHRYALDVERFYREQYKDLNIARVTVMLSEAGLTITLVKND